MYALRLLTKSIFVLLAGIVVLATALATYTRYHKYDELDSWVAVSTTVVSSAVEAQGDHRGTTYCPSIRVRYELQGREQFAGLEVKDGPCSPMRGPAATIVSRYPPGRSADALADPHDPEKVRIASYSLGIWFWVLLFVTVLVAIQFVIIWRLPAARFFNRNSGGV